MLEGEYFSLQLLYTFKTPKAQMHQEQRTAQHEQRIEQLAQTWWRLINGIKMILHGNRFKNWLYELNKDQIGINTVTASVHGQSGSAHLY